MNLYFFYKNESSNSWYDCTIEAWEENDNCSRNGKAVSSFTLIEKLHIHTCKHPDTYNCARLDHDLGTDLSTGHNAETPRQFLRDQTEIDYTRRTEINYHQFQRLKKTLLKLFSNYPQVNYTERLLADARPCRILF